MAAAAKATIGEGLACEFCGAFVFLPDADFGREAKLFVEAALFKRGTDEKRLAGARQE